MTRFSAALLAALLSACAFTLPPNASGGCKSEHTGLIVYGYGGIIPPSCDTVDGWAQKQAKWWRDHGHPVSVRPNGLKFVSFVSAWPIELFGAKMMSYADLGSMVIGNAPNKNSLEGLFAHEFGHHVLFERTKMRTQNEHHAEFCRIGFPHGGCK